MARQKLAEKYRKIANRVHDRNADPETRRLDRRAKLVGERIVRAIIKLVDESARVGGLLSTEYTVSSKDEATGAISYAREKLQKEGFTVLCMRDTGDEPICIRVNW